MSKSCLAPSLGHSVTARTFAKRDPRCDWKQRADHYLPGPPLSVPLSPSPSVCLSLSRLPFFLCLRTHPSLLFLFYPGPEEDFLISTVIKSKKSYKDAVEACANSTFRRHHPAVEGDRWDGLNMPLYNEKR